MKRGQVITLSEYRAGRLARQQPAENSGASLALPDADQLRDLLDRNISLKIWKRRI